MALGSVPPYTVMVGCHCHGGSFIGSDRFGHLVGGGPANIGCK